MIKKLNLLFHTVKYMRFKQMFYQAFYKVKNRWFQKKYNQEVSNTNNLQWQSTLKYQNSWQEKNRFIFLNLEKSFESINWNYSEFGKLWTYNLTYFDFLNQQRIDKESGLRLIRDFIENKENLKDALEPYPISLRGVNWIKFFAENKINDTSINQCLFNDYHRLRNNLEYHLLGNHLLENGFSLLFGAIYFNNENWLKKAKQILSNQLKEQILPDGGHFELSPMYHQIILYRILDCIHLLSINNVQQEELLAYLRNKAVRMLGWLETVTYRNGQIPMVNDAAHGISPSSDQLFEYSKYLGLHWDRLVLEESGYRKWETENYECFMDLGAVGPDYIPGHAHADTFNFELNLNKQPFIVDTGISTYEKNEKRQEERSTKSHNTILVNNRNQSEVWGGFRVARRARVINIEKDENGYTAFHNGYKKIGVIHKRSFCFSSEEIIIKDDLLGKITDNKAYFHFHPSLKNISILGNTIQFKDLNTKLIFNGNGIKINRAQYNFAEGFNSTKESTVIIVSFIKELTTTISFERIKYQA